MPIVKELRMIEVEVTEHDLAQHTEHAPIEHSPKWYEMTGLKTCPVCGAQPRHEMQERECDVWVETKPVESPKTKAKKNARSRAAKN